MTPARCPACDRPLATQADYDATGEGERTDLCWRAWNNDRCMHPPVDWRARALAAEERIATLETGLREVGDMLQAARDDIEALPGPVTIARLRALADNTKET